MIPGISIHDNRYGMVFNRSSYLMSLASEEPKKGRHKNYCPLVKTRLFVEGCPSFERKPKASTSFLGGGKEPLNNGSELFVPMKTDRGSTMVYPECKRTRALTEKWVRHA